LPPTRGPGSDVLNRRLENFPKDRPSGYAADLATMHWPITRGPATPNQECGWEPEGQVPKGVHRVEGRGPRVGVASIRKRLRARRLLFCHSGKRRSALTRPERASPEPSASTARKDSSGDSVTLNRRGDVDQSGRKRLRRRSLRGKQLPTSVPFGRESIPRCPRPVACGCGLRGRADGCVGAV
jgi:hypothetical protein